MRYTAVVFILLLSLGAAASAQRASVPEEGFTPMFNGQDLFGWHADPTVWSVEEGITVGRTQEERQEGTFLIFDRPISNFILRFDCRISAEGNSGLQFRSIELPDGAPWRLSGYQADIDGAAFYFGALYRFEEYRRGFISARGEFSAILPGGGINTVENFADGDEIKAAVKIGEWNSYEVIAVGPYIETRINGVAAARAVDLDTERPSGKILGFQCHAGTPMEVKIRNARIKEL
ncbi:MAG: DUF1080 domain-containing protein [Thermoguttaceae bacterium]|nr:DUF1080 domain-containing protein [Thermoguttaceae bacterium]